MLHAYLLKEFQSITIAKLIDKANHKWKVQIWNPNAYSSDSGVGYIIIE